MGHGTVGLMEIVQPKLKFHLFLLAAKWIRASVEARIHVTMLESYGRKEFHPMDAYGSHVVQKQQKKSIPCLYTALAAASECPDDQTVQFVVKWLC